MNHETFFENFELLIDAPNSVEELRELILQLAVKGKLVPQDPNEETASVLFEKIIANKERLIKEMKIKKSHSLPEIEKDEIPFDIPKTWKWVRLGEIQDFVNGYAFKSQDYLQSGIGIIRIGDIQDGEINKYKMVYVDSEIINTIDKKLRVQHGDLVIAMSGATTGKLGFNKTDETFLLNQRVGKLDFIYVNKIYGYFYLTTKIKENLSISAGSAIPNLSTAQINNIEFPLPPLEEQKRIVTKVDQLMALCDQLEAYQQQKHEKRSLLNNAALDKLLTAPTPEEFAQRWQRICDNFDLLYDAPEAVGQLRQAILQLAVQGKLVEQDPGDEPAAVLLEKIHVEKERLVKEKKIKKIKIFPPVEEKEIPFTIPKEWMFVRFYNVATIATNLVKPMYYLDLPHIAPDNIEKQTGKLYPYRTIREDKVNSGKHLFHSGQILYSKIRPNLAKATIINFEGLCSADMYPINSHIYSKYLLKYLLSPTFIKMAVKKDTRVAIPKINQAELNKILIPVPPLEEQKRIVAKVDQLIALCDELEAGLVQAQTDGGKLMEAVVHHVLVG